MNFNPKHHITRDQLSAMFGISAQHITQNMQKPGGPQELGIMRSRDKNTRALREVRFYRRQDAIQWLEKRGKKLVSTPANVVPPADINRMARKEWRPKGMLADNMARADAAYEGRGFVSAGGVGNGVERAHGYARGM